MLEIDRISKKFGDLHALRELSFSVRPGEIFGFVGSNGAGKTTTMRIALGVLASDAGEVRWRGRPVTLSTRRRIGYMPEERGLYPKMKVFEQLVYLAELHAMSAPAARKSAQHWLHRLGIGKYADDELQKLSLGNQQRAQLAAALVHEPDVLILDEPFAGLDPVAVDVMSQVLREKAATGVSVVFSSHQLDLVERLCDRVGIIAAGRMVAIGSVDELRGEHASSLVVIAPQARPGWADGLPGVRGGRYTGDRAVLELLPDADDQAVLRAALDASAVHEFSWYRPSLTELFRDVVTDGEKS